MRRPRKRPGAVPAAAVLICILVALPGAPAVAERPRAARMGALATPVKLVPADGRPIAIEGLHSYFGTIRLGSFSDGIAVVDRLPLERYLLGLNEVPVSWPAEALKAQAVAARTYARWTLEQGPAGVAAAYGFDICASDQCQVFSGADVVFSLGGFRWADAVADTTGETLLYRDRPILARYSSTSGGRTLDNPQAFPGETDYPYLQGVPSPTERSAPLWRWTVSFPLRRLQTIVEHAGWWNAGRLQDVRSISSRAGSHYPDISLGGTRGRLRVTAEELRDLVRDLAPALFPSDYPAPALTTSGRMPETFPSNRLRARTRGSIVRFVGRGWGHGVGMSQWGAYGLAARGETYRDILTHYYSGVEVGRLHDPGPIDVGVALAQSTVAATGSFSIVDGRGATVVRHALGRWTFRYAGPGAVQVEPPRGYGLPLRVSIVDAPASVDPGATRQLKIALSRPATVVASGAGRGRPPAIEHAGVSVVPWTAPARPGRYEVRVHASTGGLDRASAPVEVVVRGPTRAVPPDADDGRGGRGSVLLALVLAALAALALCVVGLKVLPGRIGA
ncbi:MAG: SpoIID/LytB domain-containing protein [Actinomycetota bacterium]